MAVVNRYAWIRIVSLFVLAVAAAAGVRWTGRVELALLDARFMIASSVSSRVPAGAVVVLVTPDTERAIGSTMGPHWRDRFAALQRALTEAGATAVVWEINFPAVDAALDQSFADELIRLPTIGAESSHAPTSDLLQSAFAGLGWAGLTVADSTPRRTQARFGLPPLGAFAAQVAGGQRIVRTDEVWIDYSHRIDRVPVLDMRAVLGLAADGAPPDEAPRMDAIRGAVVFVGTDFPDDPAVTIPGSRVNPQPTVFAHVASMWSYLDRRSITRPGETAATLIAAAFAIAMVFALTARPDLRLIGVLATTAAVLVVPVVGFVGWRLWLPMATMLALVAVAAAVVAALTGVDRLVRYRQSLGFSPRLVEYGPPRRTGDRADERFAAVVCADLRGATRLIMRFSAAEVERVVSSYMREMESIVESYGGYVNKFVGDEIVAVFGYPKDEEDVTDRAVRAGQAMIDRYRTLQAEWSVDNLPVPDGIDIGIDAGTVRFARVGGRSRSQYDLIGGVIGAAHRFQMMCVLHETSMILPAEVAEAQRVYQIDHGPLIFIGESLIKGQSRRRLYALRKSAH
ncbi:MAG: CHASE2 domain-containing protein [Spirochaetaceae bacterium]|nr:MAG: CHASE2 domain-containing protein [Spirochaetaceae bacterium]